MNVFIHATADVSMQAVIGEGTKIWHQAQVREGAHIGRNCIIGKGVYIDFNVIIGNNVKIQNGSYVYHGVTLEDGVFLGPGVILTNDRLPRAINPNGSLKTDADWIEGKILVKRGASLGAATVVLPDVNIGVFAMVGAGAVVTKDVSDYGLVMGNPARLVGFVCSCGARITKGEEVRDEIWTICDKCGAKVQVPIALWRQTV
jgi:acetyltransferase-like isoleucine patch superfamily enzyme